ncbi:LysM peptidoglycan-binding domain-containing protein [bacterium]|nr:LysM peptidoglycan-binding domain-containing protein [bacterium]
MPPEWLRTFAKKIFTSVSRLDGKEFLKRIFLFVRREGNYLVFGKRRIDISGFIPYLPPFLIVSFVIAGYLASGGQWSVVEEEFVPWTEAVVLSSIESLDPFTPLIAESKTDFVKTLREEVERPKIAFSEEGIYSLPATVAPSPQEEEESAPQRKEVITYTVQPGDTLSSIAKKFGLSVDTLKWANNLPNIHRLKVGQKLKIPPADGVLYTVKRGDTLLGIVRRYGGDLQKTLSINGLTDPSRIYPGQTILIVGGRMRTTAIARRRTTTSRTISSSGRYLPRGRYPNRFPFGWCTWYVASRRYIPWSGHAITWYWKAKAYGYAVGSVPKPGAIVVLRESWWGHVGIVEAVYGSSFLISEMNGVAGWGRVGRRVLPINYPRIVGFIY